MFLNIELYWLIPVIVVVLILAIVIIVLIFNKNKNKIKVDENFINQLIINYGGKDNIKNVSVDNARLKIEVLDLDLVNLEALKQSSESGVFVTGNIIKTLYKFDSKLIQNNLNKLL